MRTSIPLPTNQKESVTRLVKLYPLAFVLAAASHTRAALALRVLRDGRLELSPPSCGSVLKNTFPSLTVGLHPIATPPSRS